RSLSAAERQTSEAQGLLAVAAARAGDWEEARASGRAARVLGGFPDKLRPWFLVAASDAQSTKDAPAARRAAVELGPEAKDDLRRMPKSPKEDQRRGAAQILADMDDPDLPRGALLSEAFAAAPSCPDRLQILRALERSEDPRVLEVLKGVEGKLSAGDEC